MCRLRGVPERMSEGVGIRLLKGGECLEAERLWRQVFTEDTAVLRITIFRGRAAGNRGMILEGSEGIRAMLYLTPERMYAAGRPVDSAYIVGGGHPSGLQAQGIYVRASARDTDAALSGSVPFAFLMPASPRIYEPFGFSWIYDRPVWDGASFDPSALRRWRPGMRREWACLRSAF